MYKYLSLLRIIIIEEPRDNEQLWFFLCLSLRFIYIVIINFIVFYIIIYYNHPFCLSSKIKFDIYDVNALYLSLCNKEISRSNTHEKVRIAQVGKYYFIR